MQALNNINIQQIEATTPFVKLNRKDGSYVYVKKDSLTYFDYYNNLNLINPTSGSINPSVASFLDFDFLSTIVDRIDNLFFSVTISNSNAAAIYPLPLQYQLNRIEIMFQGSTVATYYSPNLLFPLLESDTETLQAQGRASGFYIAPADAAPITYGQLLPEAASPQGFGAYGIAATTGVRTYTMPLNINFLNSIWCNKLQNGNLRIRMYFNQGSALVTSTNTAYASLTYSNPVITVQGRTYSGKTRERINQEYNAAPHLARSSIARYMNSGLGTSITAGTQYQVLLGALLGQFSKIDVQYYSASNPAVSEDVLKFNTLRNISLINSAGVPYGYQQIDGTLIQQQIIPSKYDSSFSAFNPLYMFSFARNPLLTLVKSEQTGSYPLDGRASLYLVPNAAATTATTLIVVGQENVILKQNTDGSLELIQIKDVDANGI